jgi:hypothetical protein
MPRPNRNYFICFAKYLYVHMPLICYISLFYFWYEKLLNLCGRLFVIAKISPFDNIYLGYLACLGSKIAPTYLSSCLNQGLGLLEILLLKQPIQDNCLVLKVPCILILHQL